MAAANPSGFQQARMYAPQVMTQSPAPPTPQQMSSPTKEVNIAAYCRYGQEYVQDIVQKTAEVFQILKAIQLPNEVSQAQGVQAFQERKAKLDEHVRTLTLLFKRLRLIYDKVNEATSPLQQLPVEAMLPIEENGEIKGERPKQTEALKYATEEHREVVEQLELRNRQLKEIIDQLRTIIWEINTMMAMRRT